MWLWLLKYLLNLVLEQSQEASHILRLCHLRRVKSAANVTTGSFRMNYWCCLRQLCVCVCVCERERDDFHLFKESFPERSRPISSPVCLWTVEEVSSSHVLLRLRSVLNSLIIFKSVSGLEPESNLHPADSVFSCKTLFIRSLFWSLKCLKICTCNRYTDVWWQIAE